MVDEVQVKGRFPTDQLVPIHLPIRKEVGDSFDTAREATRRQRRAPDRRLSGTTRGPADPVGPLSLLEVNRALTFDLPRLGMRPTSRWTPCASTWGRKALIRRLAGAAVSSAERLTEGAPTTA